VLVGGTAKRVAAASGSSRPMCATSEAAGATRL
jgi:hypothetical protein